MILKKRILSQDNTSSFIFVAILYCFFLALPFMYFLYLKGQPHDNAPQDFENIEKIVKNIGDWRKNSESKEFVMLTRIAIFSAILAFGALGAAVSLITRARNKKSINTSVTVWELVSIQTIGAILAGILGLIFMGELIGGSLFPNSDTFYYVIYIPAAFAKLLVWSFIAGFTERFVPNILNNLVKNTNETEGQ